MFNFAPKVGDKIRWWGTEYIVHSLTDRKDVIVVKMDNGVELNLWWRFTGGCEWIPN